MPLKPAEKPSNPCFGSGPTSKYAGWSFNALDQALLGRSHRSEAGLSRIQEVLDKLRTVLQLPSSYRIGILPGSATGAIECALWNFLGLRPVDVFSWDVFGHLWAHDIEKELKLSKARFFKAPIGHLPDLAAYNPAHDMVFTWNGTASGVCVPNDEWIPQARQGLTICDGTSAVGGFVWNWEKLDVTLFSWQKVFGSEAGQGMIILSPRAIERLQEYTPSWPIPRLFRFPKKTMASLEGFFQGRTLNTPSMLCVEDYLASLKWAIGLGGQVGLAQKVQRNFKILEEWVDSCSWIEFYPQDRTICSPISPCLRFPAFLSYPEEEQWAVIQKVCRVLREEKVAFDISQHLLAAPSLRIWCGPTVEEEDIKKLLPWIEWAYHQVS